MAQNYNVEIDGPHKEFGFILTAQEDQFNRYGLDSAKNFEPNRWLTDGDQIEIDGEKLDVYH